MTCEKCIHQYVCATRRKFVDVIYQETMVLDTSDTSGIFAAIGKMCTIDKEKG